VRSPRIEIGISILKWLAETLSHVSETTKEVVSEIIQGLLESALVVRYDNWAPYCHYSQGRGDVICNFVLMGYFRECVLILNTRKMLCHKFSINPSKFATSCTYDEAASCSYVPSTHNYVILLEFMRAIL
jgi:hypothetical protein